MNELEQLKAELKQMKRKGGYVVSLKYIIDRLESIESNDCPNCDLTPVYGISALRSGLERIRKVGD